MGQKKISNQLYLCELKHTQADRVNKYFQSFKNNKIIKQCSNLFYLTKRNKYTLKRCYCANYV